MNEDARQRKIEYNAERNKQLRKDGIIKQFNCSLNYKEFNEINKILNERGLSKVDLLRFGYKKLKANDYQSNNDVLFNGKRVLQKYIPTMAMQDRTIIKEMIEEIEEIIKKDV